MTTATMSPAYSTPRSLMGRSTAAHWIMLGAGTVVYLAQFCYYYPCTFGIEDEVGYLNQALVWSRGALSAEGAGFAYPDLFDLTEHNGLHVSYRHPGRSLSILPFIMLGNWQTAFVTGALIHVLITLCAALSLVRLGRSPLWAMLVLCHPTLVLNSRTLMADTSASLAMTAAFVALTSLRRPGLWAGVAIGLAAVMRYQAGLVLPFFTLAILVTPSLDKRRREALSCLVAGGAFGMALIAYNCYAYGKPLGLYQGHGYFTLNFVLHNLAWFSAALLTIWPLMLLSPFLDRSATRWASAAVIVPLFILAVCWFYHDRHASPIYTLVLVQRQLIIILPIWIIEYAGVVETLIAPRLVNSVPSAPRRVGIGFGCVALLVLQNALFERHQQHLTDLKMARDEVSRSVPSGSTIVANSTLSKLFGFPADGLPAYRWYLYDHAEEAATMAGVTTWYIAFLPKNSSKEPPELLRDYSDRYRITRVPTQHPDLILYSADILTGRGGRDDTRLAGSDGREKVLKP